MTAKKKTKAKSRVNEAGNYTKPALRKRIFNRIKAGSKGGAPGQWSARKAQMVAKAYKDAGGGYRNSQPLTTKQKTKVLVLAVEIQTTLYQLSCSSFQ